MAPIYVKDVDVSKITFGPIEPFQSGKGGKKSYINYEGSTAPFVLKSGPVPLRWGISEFTNDGNKDVFMEVNFTVPPVDDNLRVLYEKFSLIDEAVVSTAKDNASSFGLNRGATNKGALVREKTDAIRKIVFKIDADKPPLPSVYARKEVEDEEGNKTVKDVMVEEGLAYVTKGSVVDIKFNMVYVWGQGGSFGVRLSVKAISVLDQGGADDANVF